MTLRLMKSVLLLIVCVWGMPATAAIDVYEFDTADQQDRYYALTEELRCPKCQNQNISDSDAPIAKDLRAEVFRLVSDGRSDDEVVDHLVDRFGEFVVYRPRFDPTTWVLWLGPFAIALTGIVIVLLVIRRNRKGSQAAEQNQLSDQETVRLSELLSKEDDK